MRESNGISCVTWYMAPYPGVHVFVLPVLMVMNHVKLEGHGMVTLVMVHFVDLLCFEVLFSVCFHVF